MREPKGTAEAAEPGKTVGECVVLGESMTIKVGVEGRVLVGPKGGAGSLAVALGVGGVTGYEIANNKNSSGTAPEPVYPGAVAEPFVTLKMSSMLRSRL